MEYLHNNTLRLYGSAYLLLMAWHVASCPSGQSSKQAGLIRKPGDLLAVAVKPFPLRVVVHRGGAPLILKGEL